MDQAIQQGNIICDSADILRVDFACDLVDIAYENQLGSLSNMYVGPNVEVGGKYRDHVCGLNIVRTKRIDGEILNYFINNTKLWSASTILVVGASSKFGIIGVINAHSARL